MASPSKIPPPVQNPLTSSPPPSNSPHRTDSIDDLFSLERIDSEEDSPPRKEKHSREDGVLSDVDAPLQRRRLDIGSRAESGPHIEPDNLVRIVGEEDDVGGAVDVS